MPESPPNAASTTDSGARNGLVHVGLNGDSMDKQRRTVHTTGMVHRTTVDLDQERLAEVRGILGTVGIRDTIDAAFAQVVRAARREALLKQLLSGDGLDLGPNILSASRPDPA